MATSVSVCDKIALLIKTFDKTSSIRTKMRPIYVRMKEFSWICLNLLELYWINLNSLFPDVLLSLSVDFRDIWETRDRRTTDHGPRTDKASYRDAWTHLKSLVNPHCFETIPGDVEVADYQRCWRNCFSKKGFHNFSISLVSRGDQLWSNLV